MLQPSASKKVRIVSSVLPEKSELKDLSIKTIQLDKKELQDVPFDPFNGELTSLFNCEKCLQGCTALTLPIHTIDGLKKDRIETYQCESLSDILSVTNQLKPNELAFIIYRRKWDKTECRLIDLEVSFTFTLLTNQGLNNKSQALNIVNELFSSRPEGTEFFGIKFDLWFEQKQKLREIVLLRGVNPDWRRKKVSTQISLNCLEQLFNMYSGDEPQLNFRACHIGTVKFCYPLNPFYHRETKEHLRDIDPEHSDLKLSEFIRNEGFEDYSDFSYDGITTSAHCPHQFTRLSKLLLQYKVRKILDQV